MYEIGPNVVIVALALISAVGSILAAIHANEARRNSEATHNLLVKETMKRRS